MAFNYKTEYERYRKYYRSLEPVIQKGAKRNYTMAIFSFLAISLFGWYGIKPTIQTILFLRREITDNQEVNKRMEEKITHLVEAQANYQNALNTLPFLDQALPQDPNAFDVIVQLKNLAKATDASISAILVPTTPLLSSETGPQAVNQTGKLVEIPVAVTVNGSYTTIKAFLDKLVSMRRLFSIETINLASSKEETVQKTLGTPLRLVLKIHTYYMPVKTPK